MIGDLLKQAEAVPEDDNIIFRIRNADGHFWNSTKWRTDGQAQNFKTKLNATNEAYRVSLVTGIPASIVTYRLIEEREDNIALERNFELLTQVRKHFHANSSAWKHLFNLSVEHNLEDWPYLITRENIPSGQNKYIENNGGVDMIISPRSSSNKFISVRDLESIALIRLNIGEKLKEAVNIFTNEKII